jgi:hypothetical protein
MRHETTAYGGYGHTLLLRAQPGHRDGAAHRVVQLLNRRPGRLAAPAARWAVTVLAVAGAVLLADSGYLHLRLWLDGYRSISVIGPLFLIQAVASFAAAAAAGLFRRLGVLAAGAMLMAGTAAGLLLTVYVGLFGYRESLAVPYAGMSLVVELSGAAVLAAAAILLLAPAAPRGPRPLHEEKVWPQDGQP